MRYLFITCFLFLSGCSAWSVAPAKSLAETKSGFTYIPVDAFAIKRGEGGSCHAREKLKPILEALPDNAVRISQEQTAVNGKISYGPAGATAKGETYKIILDYTISDTTNVTFYIGKQIVGVLDNKFVDFIGFSDVVRPGTRVSKYVVVRKPTNKIKNTKGERLPEISESYYKQVLLAEDRGFDEYNIPVYVGIGMRVTAHVASLEAGVNIDGLGVLGLEAAANRIKGSLVVQTLGVNGEAISAALPVPSELNSTTVQNAVVAIGTMKSQLYQQDIYKSPRVVGLYLPIPGDISLVNGIISELSRERVEWHWPCG